MTWQLQDAKNRFSEVVHKATTLGPQIVTVRGKPTAVVISMAEFERLQGPKMSLGQFLMTGEPWDDEFAEQVSARNSMPARDVDL